MRIDPEQEAHTEAGPLWFTVRYVTTKGAVQFARIRQPVLASKVKRSASATLGYRVGALATGPGCGVLLGAYKVVGTYTVLGTGSRYRS